ncbi:YqaA family protein [Haloarchaeobius salinus]|uniref:YqaA family protein n=1 Tax=Haloarchaeobius salinus TaxID=1198298 RepID=UPI003F5E3B33
MSTVSTPSLALLDTFLSVDPVVWLPLSEFIPDFAGLAEAVRNASGVIGLAIIAVYSFLIAFVLPLPSEVVLAPVRTGTLALGLPTYLEYAIVIVVSGVGKAAGSVFAFHIGQEAKESGPVVRFLRNSRFNIIEWSEKKSVELARRYGYVGLAMALSVPFFPDTISIYAFAVLERDYKKFALATFAGSVGRLLVTMGAFGVAFVFL